MPLPSIMAIETFADINLNDPFFDTLKDDYPGFDRWFAKKADAGEVAYVTRNSERSVNGFLYLKQETGSVDDVTPALPPANRIKVGTFKIESRGTKMGQRFLKKVFDRALDAQAEEIYVTVFEKHDGLTKLFDRYGFQQIGVKAAANGDAELVMRRDLRVTTGDLVLDYPFIHSNGVAKYLLSIYPKYHTKLFPDSKLNTEEFDIVQDLSHTNSIHKVYIGRMSGVEQLQPGDLLVIYRTRDPKLIGSAEYLSVATSIGVVEDVCPVSSFPTEEEFLACTQPFSVFGKTDLQSFYRAPQSPYMIRFTYNAALSQRIIRKRLIEEVGLSRGAYFGFLPITNEQFQSVVDLGGLNANLIVD